ncbi:MAG: hypothetical protein CMM91_11590 [Rickettsiales bacterium]|jgi:hypothetical protein|nr:hypothetical protein [Rickettsiales bacterium]MAI85549.1 hypothetical protein [Rickettsiales bacterium]|tara:strand:+ start:1503 stop:1700 length:198 start_codon:yes stop_codon:yes gene_type:complete
MAKINIFTNNDNRSKSYQELTMKELETKVNQLEKEAKRVQKDPQLRKQVLRNVKDTKIEIAKRIK